MYHAGALEVDYGPDFLGYASIAADKKIRCVVPTQPSRPSEAAAAMRELVEGLGGNCGECRCCPLGRGD